MSKKEEANNVQGTELAKVNETANTVVFNSFDEMVFEDTVDELLSSEFLKEIQGVEINAIMRGVVTRDFGDGEKELVELHIQTNDGYRSVLAGQYKFIRLYLDKDKGNGVAIRFIFKGLIKIKGGRTMNDFDIKYCAL